MSIDLKHREGREATLKLVARSHALIEGFRPGVMERLDLGPEVCLARNPRLVYGRVTGWGRDGPLARAAGHDIDYIALTGALHGIGDGEGPPVPPLNLVGDFGGGGVYLALGLVAGMLEAKTSGKGQVIDAAMVDGAASQMTFVYGLRAAGQWTDRRAANTLDGGAPQLPGLPNQGWEVHRHRPGGAQVLGRAAETDRSRGGRSAQAGGSIPVAADVGALGRNLSHPDPGRVAPPSGGKRRLLRPGSRHGRGSGASPQPGEADLREGARAWCSRPPRRASAEPPAGSSEPLPSRASTPGMP